MADPRKDAVRVALTWLAAIHNRDWDALAAASAPDIVMQHPHGPARGLAMLKAWFDVLPLRIEPLRIFEEGGGVLVEHRARWVDPEGREAPELIVATVLQVVGGRVARYWRDENLDGHLARFGFEEADEMPFHVSGPRPGGASQPPPGRTLS